MIGMKPIYVYMKYTKYYIYHDVASFCPIPKDLLTFYF